MQALWALLAYPPECGMLVIAWQVEPGSPSLQRRNVGGPFHTELQQLR